jgi:hypothetical protein
MIVLIALSAVKVKDFSKMKYKKKIIFNIFSFHKIVLFKRKILSTQGTASLENLFDNKTLRRSILCAFSLLKTKSV